MDKIILQKLIDNNLSSHKIAKELGISQTTVQYYLKKYQMTTKASRGRGRKTTRTPVLCINCGNNVNKNATKYCSFKCQNDYQYNNFILGWLTGSISGNRKNGLIASPVRRYLFEKQQGKCALCKNDRWVNDIYDGTIPLEGDHIDGNWENSSPKNVRLICPTCHATTATWKARNTGNYKSRIR